MHFGATKFSGMFANLLVLACLEKITPTISAIYSSQLGSIFAMMYNYCVPHQKIFPYFFGKYSLVDYIDFKIINIIKNIFKERILKKNNYIYSEKARAFLNYLFSNTLNPRVENCFAFAEELAFNVLHPFYDSQETSIQEAILATNCFLGMFPPFTAYGKQYVDGGRLGNLPMRAIYENEIKNNPSPKEKYIVIAFYEDFYIENELLKVQERLYYSFYEKIRYYHTKENIDFAQEKSMKLFLFQYQSCSIKNSNIFKLVKPEKYSYIDKVINNLQSQIELYTRQLEKTKKIPSLCRKNY